MIAWGEAPAIDELIARRLKGALELRRRFVRDDTNAYRLVNGDGDGLSGVVVDRFGEVLVVQILTAGADRMRAAIVAALGELLHPRSIIERSHGAVRKQEGLEDHTAVLAGEAVASAVASENGIKLKIDFEHGQKTGYFLDQRDNRALPARSRRARACSTHSATRAVSRSRLWRAVRAKSSRSIRRRGRSTWRAKIWS